MYRYRAKTHLIDDGKGEGDGCDPEKQLRSMFPDYGGYLDDEGVCEEGTTEGGREGESEPDKLVWFTAEELQSIANLHLLLYNKEGFHSSGCVGGGSTTGLYNLAGDLMRFLEPIPGKKRI